MAEKNKKKSKGGTAVGAAALILLLAGGGYGVGRGQGMLPNEGDSLAPQPEQVQEEVVEQEPVEEIGIIEDDGVLTVRVSESQIYYEQQPVSASELEEALLADYSEGAEVELVDDMAIKAEYDEAAAVLNKLGIAYTAK